MPAFPGSAWRGALGYALKRAVCVTREPVCAACLLYRSCAYPYVFQTPPPTDAAKMRLYNAVPHPFALRVVTTGVDGLETELILTLFGDGNRYLPVLIHALTRAACSGRGVAGNKLDMDRVMQETTPGAGEWRTVYCPGGSLAALPVQPPAPPPTPAGVSITFDAPLRIKRDGNHVTPDQFCFADLFASLLRRVSMLTYFHTETPLDTDFRALVDSAKRVTSHNRLRWSDLGRHSASQKTSMLLGGLVGSTRIECQDLGLFWPYLWLGQFTHAGTAATMGLGHYTLTSLPDQTMRSTPQ